MLTYKKYVLLPSFETNTYLVWNTVSEEAMLIDPAAPAQNVVDFCRENHLILKFIVNTHGHADHIGGNSFFAHELNAQILIHKDDAQMLSDSELNLSAFLEADLTVPHADKLLIDCDVLELGDDRISIIHTPGHTKGCICLYGSNLLFSGDTLFHLDIGRTDLPSGNERSLITSVRSKLFILPEDTLVLPGHGPTSTIGNEKYHNPYLKNYA